MMVTNNIEEEVESIIHILKNYLENQDMACEGVRMRDPKELEEKVKKIMDEGSKCRNGAFDKELFSKMVSLYLDYGLSVHSVGSMGRQYTGNASLTAVMDMVNSIANQPSSFYEASQIPCVVEHVMGEILNEYVGFNNGNASMICTSGGSLANLTALLTARNYRYKECRSTGMLQNPSLDKPTVAMSEDAHYSLIRAVEILGIGKDNIIWLPMNEKRQIDITKVPSILDRAKEEGKDVFCIVASAGTTPVGAIDPLRGLAILAHSNGAWLHVDGCHGASLLLSERYRQKLEGIDEADSLSWDAHKMLAVPSPCSLLFYKDRKNAMETFRQSASYVTTGNEEEYGNGEINFECTKRPSIMNLWTLWTIYGKSYFENSINNSCGNCMEAYLQLQRQKDFVPLNRPEMNILCFKYVPQNLPSEFDTSDFQTQVRNEVCRRGKFYISKVKLNGDVALRVVIMNPKHSRRDFENLMNEIRTAGDTIIKQTTIKR